MMDGKSKRLEMPVKQDEPLSENAMTKGTYVSPNTGSKMLQGDTGHVNQDIPNGIVDGAAKPSAEAFHASGGVGRMSDKLVAARQAMMNDSMVVQEATGYAHYNAVGVPDSAATMFEGVKKVPDEFLAARRAVMDNPKMDHDELQGVTGVPGSAATMFAGIPMPKEKESKTLSVPVEDDTLIGGFANLRGVSADSAKSWSEGVKKNKQMSRDDRVAKAEEIASRMFDTQADDTGFDY